MGRVANSNHNLWMERALAKAREAEALGEVPVGAVVVVGDEEVGAAFNQVETLKDPTAHAEILALREAAHWADSWRLDDARLYVTMEPCPMCIGAILLSRMNSLWFGCKDPTMGAVGSVFDLSAHDGLPRRVQVYRGVMEDECGSILREFFKKRRAKPR